VVGGADGSVCSFALADGISNVELVGRNLCKGVFKQAVLIAAVARDCIAVVALFARIDGIVPATGNGWRFIQTRTVAAIAVFGISVIALLPG
jgi:hypothetical protein